MTALDLAILIGYVLAVSAFGAVVGARSRGLKGYFLGGGTVPGWALLLSIVATETSTATFLSVPSLSFQEGGDFTYLQLAIGYIIGRIFVAAVLLPGYFRGALDTAYQVLAVRFGGATKTAASLLFLASRTLGDGLRLFLAAVVLRELFEIGGLVGPGAAIPERAAMPSAIAAMGVSTIVYTFIGGMRAVIWTDATQFAVYMVGAVAALAIMVGQLDGGWADLVRAGESAGKFRLFRFDLDLAEPYTIYAGVIGGAVFSAATHGTDQLMVQRYLAAGTRGKASAALVASGFVVLAQFALFLLIGVGLFALFQQRPPESSLATDREFAYFIVRYMPTGLLGLVVAAIFSAAMSTLSSSLNASASSTVNDLIRPAFPSLEEPALLRISKLATIGWGVAQMAVAVVADVALQRNVVDNVLAIAAFVSGVILGVFLLGVLARRADQRAALIGLVAGLLVVSYAKFGPSIFEGRFYPFEGALAWPYTAPLGAGVTLLIGWIAARLGPVSGATYRTEPDA